MKLAITAAFLIAILVGCATTGNYEKVLNSWVGVKTDQLISKWGPPHKSFELSNGGLVLEYYQQNYTGYYNSYTNTFHNIKNACKTLFTVNAAGIIKSWRWQGNACKL